MKKYSTSGELDALRVLSNLPEYWLLDEEEGLFHYLSNTLSHLNNQGRETALMKQLSETNLLDIEYELCRAKMANVRMTEGKKCRICEKPIMERVFAVFPNAVVVHQNCIKKEKGYSICPKTEHRRPC